jgi:hypothetical protein
MNAYNSQTAHERPNAPRRGVVGTAPEETINPDAIRAAEQERCAKECELKADRYRQWAEEARSSANSDNDMVKAYDSAATGAEQCAIAIRGWE